jgi:UDP-glucose 4-epimerase
VILVPHNIVGARQKFDDPYRNVASIFTNRMLTGLNPIIYGDGSQQRCFSFIQDVMNPLMVAVDSPDAVGQVINLGPDESTITILELAERIADILGFELKPIYMKGRPQEVKVAHCSSDKARRLLGYETSVHIDKGLRELVEWIQSKGAREFNYHLPIEIVNELTPVTWTRKLM